MKTLSNNTGIKKASIAIIMVIATLGSATAQKSVSDFAVFTNNVQIETIINNSFNAVKDIFSSSAVGFEMEVAEETSLEIESWMLNAETWESEMINEPAMELENWMVNTNTWETAIIEEKLIIEDWMVTFHENIQDNEVIAEDELALEAWMLNTESWNR
ncbi:MAG: hypothetical protein ACOC2F_05335 [Bacteroidota bacterium]